MYFLECLSFILKDLLLIDVYQFKDFLSLLHLHLMKSLHFIEENKFSIYLGCINVNG